MDWGSIMVYTCGGSCKESGEECVVVQYETDAIRDEDVRKLKKRNKNRRKKDRKGKSKDKGEKEKGGKEES